MERFKSYREAAQKAKDLAKQLNREISITKDDDGLWFVEIPAHEVPVIHAAHAAGSPDEGIDVRCSALPVFVYGASLSPISMSHDVQYYMGLHAKVGLIVLDKICQQGLSDAWVRLYVVAEQRWGRFTKASLVGNISPLPGDIEKYRQDAIVWSLIRKRIKALRTRKARCHGCGRSLRHLNIQFALSASG